MSITRSQTERIGSIFNGNKFVIPKYQRKYSWTHKETKALWTDIKESLDKDMNHFIGTLCFKENDVDGLATETEYEVIDGQQRLTTLFILLSVLIDRLSDEKVKAKQKDSFINGEDGLKVMPLGVDGDFLERLINDYESISITDLEKRSHIKMYKAKRQFLALSNNLTNDQVTEWILFVRDRIEVLVFNVENQAQAVKMFSIINDRGLPLRILDKTKSILMLYSTLYLNEEMNSKINDEFEHIFDSYDSIMLLKDSLEILGRFDENTMFTHHYYSSHKLFPDTWNNRDAASTIFVNIKNKCEQLRDDSSKLKKFISSYVKDFSAFSVSYSNLIQEVKDNDSFRRPFQYLEFAATLYPVIVRLYMQDKLESLIDILEVLEVRVYKLKGTNPISDMYWLSSDLSRRNMPIEEIRNRLLFFGEKFMNDHNFKNYLNSDIYGNRAVKFILYELSGDEMTYSNYKDLQVEHIFSREPNFLPKEYGFKEDYDFEKNRLGNLSLIEEKLNKSSSVRNNPPINKVGGYLKSQVRITRDLAGEINGGKFDHTSVNDRRDSIIEFCIDRFNLN